LGRRSGAELVELIAAQPFSVRTTVDLTAGAIDAWIHPQLLTAVQATPDAQGATTMMARLMKLECAGYGSTVTPADVKKSLAITLGGTIVLMLGWWWVRQPCRCWPDGSERGDRWPVAGATDHRSLTTDD
jgi:hypothetical protein